MLIPLVVLELNATPADQIGAARTAKTWINAAHVLRVAEGAEPSTVVVELVNGAKHLVRLKADQDLRDVLRSFEDFEWLFRNERTVERLLPLYLYKESQERVIKPGEIFTLQAQPQVGMFLDAILLPASWRDCVHVHKIRIGTLHQFAAVGEVDGSIFHSDEGLPLTFKIGRVSVGQHVSMTLRNLSDGFISPKGAAMRGRCEELGETTMKNLAKVTSADPAMGGGHAKKLRAKALADALGGTVKHAHKGKAKKKSGHRPKKKKATKKKGKKR